MAMQSDAVETPSSGFFGAQFLNDPFSLFAQMRAMGAVVPTPFPTSGQQKAWMITRMEEALLVLKDSERFPVNSAVFTMFDQSMLTVDGLDHRRLRGLVSKVFTPRYIQGLRPSIQQIVDTLFDQVEGKSSMDLVEEFAFPLPINVISDMLGVPHDSWDVLRDGSRALLDGGALLLDEKEATKRTRKLHAYNTYITQLIAEKRRQPQDDLISQLIQIEEEGDRLSEPELVSMIGLLIIAGHETTSNLIGTGMLALFDHPEQLAKLRADLSLVPSAIEELLRFTGPLLTPAPRLATEDVELGGQHILRGDILIPVLTSANRDERHFTDAVELDLARRIDRHLAFGYGIHMCLGAPLARLEGAIAFTALLQRLPNARLAVPREAITWYGALNVRGLISLPISF
jgi:cytochrome P450